MDSQLAEAPARLPPLSGAPAYPKDSGLLGCCIERRAIKAARSSAKDFCPEIFDARSHRTRLIESFHCAPRKRGPRLALLVSWSIALA